MIKLHINRERIFSLIQTIYMYYWNTNVIITDCHGNRKKNKIMYIVYTNVNFSKGVTLSMMNDKYGNNLYIYIMRKTMFNFFI